MRIKIFFFSDFWGEGKQGGAIWFTHQLPLVAVKGSGLEKTGDGWMGREEERMRAHIVIALCDFSDFLSWEEKDDRTGKDRENCLITHYALLLEVKISLFK